MSNIDIDFQKDEKLHFKPLIYYNDFGEEYSHNIFHLPSDKPSLEKRRDKACPGFRIPGILPTQQRNTLFPEFHSAAFGPKKYFLLENPTLAPAPRDDGFPWLLLFIILALLVLLVLIVMCIVCCCKRCKKKNQTKLPTDNGDTHPLKPVTKKDVTELLEDNYDVPDPITVVPRRQNQSPPMEMIDDDDDESSLSLNHYAEEPIQADLSDFTQNPPQRISSFRDPNAPPGSPLNRSGHSPTPKKLVAASIPVVAP
ncbi:hypothetical protein L596_007619 [Steinernema carpocapsae]|uniref:Uncharacterized protein n=1 Tax=Steinernema carpocapsae TaxID=34508 RepID=A0A4V6A617_STECR|nr:hypothetical protein L596_007619 [Steinernema carpocapsae]